MSLRFRTKLIYNYLLGAWVDFRYSFVPGYLESWRQDIMLKTIEVNGGSLETNDILAFTNMTRPTALKTLTQLRRKNYVINSSPEVVTLTNEGRKILTEMGEV